MNTSAKLIIFSILILPLFSTACVVNEFDRTANHSTSENVLDDAAITTKIKAKFLADKKVGALDIHVETYNGRVILTGEAPTNEIKNRAITIAKRLKGVKSVTARIDIVPDY